ncbi:hypothetical protein B0H13DRAFT_1891333 [Mycena leptocephala]|nr:hypothetical protein B0H13DRAFT_1891333 [Mycena leptocephala]
MKTKGADKVQLSWEKVKTRFTFGAKGMQLFWVGRQSSRGGSNSSVKRGKVGAAQVHPKMAQILYPRSRGYGPRNFGGYGWDVYLPFAPRAPDLIGKVMHGQEVRMGGIHTTGSNERAPKESRVTKHEKATKAAKVAAKKPATGKSKSTKKNKRSKKVVESDKDEDEEMLDPVASSGDEEDES